MSQAYRELRYARRVVERIDPNQKAVRHGSSGHYEQHNHGTTVYALAAWFDVRHEFKEAGIKAVGGTNEYPVRVGDGYADLELGHDDVLKEQAFYVECRDGRTIYLTGCSWGYGGEGPHGTAVVLMDLGLYKTLHEAMVFIYALRMQDEWRREL